MTESLILKKVRLALQAMRVTLFRNNQGAVKTDDGRFIRYGVCNPGGSDCIGFLEYQVTEEDVGRRLAVFTAVETKTLTGRVSPEQKAFLSRVAQAGGIAIVARSESEAVAALRAWRGRRE